MHPLNHGAPTLKIKQWVCSPSQHRLLLAPVCTVLQRQRFHGHFQYLYIESICNDQTVLEQNYRYKMMYSPDYARVDSEQAS